MNEDVLPVETDHPQADRDADGNNSAGRVSLTHTVELRRSRMPKRGEREVRTLPIERLEVRENDENNTLTLAGYASVFNRRYSVGLYEEEIAPGAFKRSLSNPNLDCVLRIEHDGLPIARTSSGTLRLAEDAEGLWVEADLDPTDPDVQRLVPKYRRGDLREMSFAFRCNDDVWSEDYSQRTVRSAEIHRGDVSIVTYGASPTTNSTLRSEQALADLRGVGEGAMIGALQDFAVQWVATYLQRHGARATVAMLEERVGAKFSSDSTETLTRVLALVAAADDAVDEAQPLLADLMGVPNPDDDDGDDGDGERAAADATEATRVVELPRFRGDEFLLELRALEGRR